MPVLPLERRAPPRYIGPMPQRVIDFHTHAFPDALAGRAMGKLEEEGGLKAPLDGKVSSLLAAMDRAGVERAVLSPIATKPAQFRPILDWSLAVASERLVPFASVHPDDPQSLEHIREAARAGLRGLKLHPYYQGCVLDEARMYRYYAAVREAGLVLLLHSGYDLAFPRDDVADPARTRRVADAFPDLALVASHLGAWEDWDRVEAHLAGTAVYLDVSYCHVSISRAQARRILFAHPADRLLFGSDAPWAEPLETLEWVLALDLGEERTRALLYDNAARLLGLPTSSPAPG